MKAERIKEIQKETAYPDSVSVYQALMKVWNECSQSEPNTVTEDEIYKIIKAYEEMRAGEIGQILDNNSGNINYLKVSAHRLSMAFPKQTQAVGVNEDRTEELWDRFSTIIGEEEDDFVVKVMTKPQFELAIKELLNQKK